MILQAYNLCMMRTPWWGSKLYDPETLQRRTSLITFDAIRPPWRRVLLAKRKALVTIFALNVLITLFLLAVAALLLYMSLVVGQAHEGQWAAPFLVSLCLLAIAYTGAHAIVCLFYFLFAGKRDIEKILQSQVDYGVQHNIWP